MFEFIFAVIVVCCTVSLQFLILRNKTHIRKYFEERKYRKALEERCEDLTLEIEHLKEELQVTKDQRSAAFRKIEELLDEMNKE